MTFRNGRLSAGLCCSIEVWKPLRRFSTNTDFQSYLNALEAGGIRHRLAGEPVRRNRLFHNGDLNRRRFT